MDENTQIDQLSNVISTTPSSNAPPKVEDRIVAFPTKMYGMLNDSNIAYVMFSIYDRESAKKLESDSGVAVSVQQDGVASAPIKVPFFSTTEKLTRAEIRDKYKDDKLINQQLGSGSDTTKFIVDTDKSRLNRVLVLPMPNQLDHGLRTNINQKSAGAINAAFSDPGGAALAAGKDLLPDIADAVATQGFNKGGDSQSARQRTILAGLEKLRGQGTAAIDTFVRQQGLITNDRREMWFEGVEFREFTFTYTFSPRDITEVNVLKEIIKSFRFYMLPTYNGKNTAGKFFLIQPSEFEMKFMIGSNENRSIPKIDRCLLKACNVNYSPRDKWIMLSNGEGFPPEISLQLQFVEKQLMYREKVALDTATVFETGF